MGFSSLQVFVLLLAATAAYQCYECSYKGNNPENHCLTASKDSGTCETTKGCEKHYSEKTIAGETIFEITRSCKHDDICYTEYVNCHDLHVSVIIY